MNSKMISIRRYRVVLLVLLLAFAAAAFAGDESKSLKQICEEADRLAQTPEGLEDAIAKYHSVIEIHRANEKVFLAALQRLLKHCDESDRIEDGARVLITVIEDLRNPERMKDMQNAFGGFAMKHRDVLDKVTEEMGLTAQQKREKKAKERAERIVPSRKLIDAILQRKDKALREESLTKLRQMLSPESSNRDKGTALVTLRSALTAKFDRKPFRPLVAPLLKSEDAEIRMRALQCFPALEATTQDLELIIPLAEDDSPQVRQEVGGALISIGDGREKEKVIPALMKLLKDEEYKVIERTLRSMWGQYASPEFDALLIELSRNPRHRGHVIYHCLSTMRTKSPEVCRRLVEELDEPDWNDSGRAAWGLGYGVVEEAYSLVEEGLLKALPEETNSYTRKQEFRALRRVATEKSRPYLKSVVESDMETQEHKELARQILTDLD
ncbi:HEAT repeat domain-containing protein [Planctomycetota bacterium]